MSGENSDAVTDAVEISLFPIPGVVCFPGQRVPLHIFEPRYRALVKDSASQKRRIGVSQTARVISPAKPNQTKEEALHTNQATYEPVSIFSAGFVEIVEVLPDGRMIVEIEMDGRYQRGPEIQTIPYRVCTATRFDDEAQTEIEQQAGTVLRQQLDDRFKQLAEAGKAELKDLTECETWTSMPLDVYSFRVFQFVRLPAEIRQQVLELRSPAERLRVMLGLLN